MYKTQSPDTSVEVEKLQFEKLRNAGSQKRVARMNSMSSFVIKASRQAIRKAHPNWSESEVLLFWLRQQYGAQISENVLRDVKAKS